MNPAWFAFSEANHGEPIISERYPVGTTISAAMSAPFKDFYLNIYQDILQKGTVWEHDYECSTPETYRMFQEIAYPLHGLEGILL